MKFSFPFRIGCGRLPLLLLLLVLNLSGCDQWNKVEGFFSRPPSGPLTRTLKTIALVGYGSSVAAAWMDGQAVPGISQVMNKSTAVFYIDLEASFPFRFKGDQYREGVLLAFRVSEDLAILTFFLGESDIRVGSYRLNEIRTFPLVRSQGVFRAIFASNDINIGGGYDLEIQLTQEELDFEIVRSQTPPPSDEYIAVDQNAWVIEIDRNQSPVDLSDDRYLVSGGEQMIEVMGGEIPEASTMQLAMIQTVLSPICGKNPIGGYAFMNNLGVSSDITKTVIAQALIEFPGNCTGKATVLAAFGNYIATIGKKIPLDLVD